MKEHCIDLCCVYLMVNCEDIEVIGDYSKENNPAGWPTRSQKERKKNHNKK